MGFVIVLTLYLIIGLPLSLLADYYCRGKSMHLQRTLLYGLLGMCIAVLFMMMKRSSGPEAAIFVATVSGAGLTYGMVQGMLHALIVGKYMQKRR